MFSSKVTTDVPSAVTVGSVNKPAETSRYIGWRRVILEHGYHQFSGNDFKVVPEEVGLGDLKINEYLEIVNSTNPQLITLARFDGTYLVPLRNELPKLFKIKPKNPAQHFMLDCLTPPLLGNHNNPSKGRTEERIVVIEGPAGTGKTLMTVVAGIDGNKRGKFDNFIFTRANVESDATLGWVPGEIVSKMDWLIGPIYDNLAKVEPTLTDLTLSASAKAEILKNYHIAPIPLSYMRGRSFDRSFIMVEEAQNLTAQQAKMIATRAGHGSMVVFIGDVTQIDSRYLNQDNNGLMHVFESMDNVDLCFRLRDLKTDVNCRSLISRIASERL